MSVEELLDIFIWKNIVHDCISIKGV